MRRGKGNAGDNVHALESLLEEVESLKERVVSLLKEERTAERAPDQVNEVVAAAKRAQQALAGVSDYIDDIPEVVVEQVKKARSQKRARKMDVGEKEDEEEEEVVNGSARTSKRLKRKTKKVIEQGVSEEQDERKPKKTEKKKNNNNNNVSKKKVLDGMVGKVKKNKVESLVYFSSGSERDGMFDCPSLAPGGGGEGDEDEDLIMTAKVTVERAKIGAVRYRDLNAREKKWYQAQLEVDMLQRFEVNFPVLFANYGCNMMETKVNLLDDPTKTNDLIQRWAQGIDATKAVLNASPNLSAVNNSALMLSAVSHKNLSRSGEQGWYKKYQQQVEEMSKYCDLLPSSMERYRKVGELMLRCDVVACLLPSFVEVVQDVVEAILNDNDAAARLENAFKAKFQGFAKGLGNSSVLELEVGGQATLLESQARSLLLESSSARQGNE